jgi:hypothetical protein
MTGMFREKWEEFNGVVTALERFKNNVAVRSEDFWCFWRGFGEGACLKTL